MTRARVRYGTAALSGAMLAGAFPPLGWSGLAWGALVPWFATLLRDRGEGHRGPAYLFGMVFFPLGLSWLWPLHPAFPFALSAILALYPLLFAFLFRRIAFLGPVAAVPFLPALWVGVDLLRERALSGFPWLLPGHAFARWEDLRQAADLGGVHLLTFAAILANAAGALLVVHATRPKRKIGVPAPARWGTAAAALLLPLALSIYGGARRESLRDGPGPRVLLVQPSFSQGIKQEALHANPRHEEMRDVPLALGWKALQEHPDTDLVVWAETMIPGELRETAPGRTDVGDPATRSALSRIVDPMGIVPGSRRRFLGGALLRDRDLRRRNSALLVGPVGTVEGRFDKVHLTPFGEYLPLVDLLPEGARNKVVNGVLEFSPFLPDLVPGTSRPVTVAWGAGRPVRLGGLICYEVVFPAHARERVADGADVLVNLSNYAWYGPWMHEQVLDITRFRAVENRRPVVVATNDGPTAILDGNGEVRRSLPVRERGVLAAEVPLDGRASPYAALGPAFAILASAAALAGVAWGIVRRRRERGGSGGSPGRETS